MTSTQVAVAFQTVKQQRFRRNPSAVVISLPAQPLLAFAFTRASESRVFACAPLTTTVCDPSRGGCFLVLRPTYIATHALANSLLTSLVAKSPWEDSGTAKMRVPWE